VENKYEITNDDDDNEDHHHHHLANMQLGHMLTLKSPN